MSKNYESLKELLVGQGQELALVIGNGINLYGAENGKNSWEDVLNRLAKKHISDDFEYPDKGLSLTEFYDILELEGDKRKGRRKINFQKEFREELSVFECRPHHQMVVKYCIDKGIPILTTNFDSTLSDAAGCQMYKTIITGAKGFTDYYPWECYYAHEKLKEPAEPASGFGIWHINGMNQYSRSFRLGLTHYMGSVQRVRNWMNSGLHGNGDIKNWRGNNTYLQILLTRPLAFFGLSLEENEVFLRWLLIERERYFRKCSKERREMRQNSWYFYKRENSKDEISKGKRLFFKSVGIELVEFGKYYDIYGDEVWTNTSVTQTP